jgi:insulysin
LINRVHQYLAKNNGKSNAYTSTSNTNYYFNVATPALSGALERFAAFFHSPLFAPSCTSRELNAVDSEHKKNHQADLWRVFQVTKHISRDGHVWHKFGSGNRESLLKAAKDLKAIGKLNGSAVSRSNSLPPSSVPSRVPSPTPSIAPSVASNSSESDDDGGSVGRETRRRLVEWWSREYCASRMRLCIIGKGAFVCLYDLSSSHICIKIHWTSFPNLLLSSFLPFRIVDKIPFL